MTPRYKYDTVLLIDDNDLDNFINEKMIESLHFSKNITISMNGEKALTILKTLISEGGTSEKGYPDVIFVDLNMPIMNGFEFIERFKKLDDQKLTQCKLVILTSSIQNNDRVKAEQLDRNIVFANKPLTNELLNSL